MKTTDHQKKTERMGVQNLKNSEYFEREKKLFVTTQKNELPAGFLQFT